MTTSILRITSAHTKALERQPLLACRTPEEVDGVADAVCEAYGLSEEMPCDCTWADCARVLGLCMDGTSDEIALPHPLTPPAYSSLRALADFLTDVQVRRNEVESDFAGSLHLDPTGMPTRCQMCTANHPYEAEVFPFCSYKCAATDTLEECRGLVRCYACGQIADQFVRTRESGELDDRPFCLTCMLDQSDAAIEAIRTKTIEALRAEAFAHRLRYSSDATSEA